MTPGTCVTWVGKKIDFDDEVVNWEVTRVTVAKKPENLKPRQTTVPF
jgi:hypothetical protein